MADEFDNEGESVLLPTSYDRGNGSAVVALLLPVLAGSVLFFITSTPLAYLIAGATVLASAILLAVDFSLLEAVDQKGQAREHAGLVFVALCAIWILGFPIVFFRRQSFRKPNFGILSVIVALYFAIGPLAWSWMMPPGLPSSTSSEVVTLLEQIVRASPAGGVTRSIDGHHEISFDKERSIRHGRCTLHSDAGDTDLDYFVEWQDRDKRLFQVRIPPGELPLCDSSQVVALVEQAFRSTPDGANLKSIDGHREVRFDENSGIRLGHCIAHTESADTEINYLVEWLNREKGQFQVRLPPTELPSCTNADVIRLVEEVIRNDNPGATIGSIDGHREISFDSINNIRHGVCNVHLDSKVVEGHYIVKWLDRAIGYYGVQTVQPPEI